jgi:hypothetical protein
MICKAKFVPTVKEIMPQQRRRSFAADVAGLCHRYLLRYELPGLEGYDSQ